MMIQRSALLSIALCYLLVACDDRPTPAASMAAPGDTVRVVTVGDGKWGAPYVATEIMRISNDRKETTFGNVQDLVVRADDGFLVFDEEGPEGAVLRSFDSLGKFERNYGRKGNGPGEYMPPRIRVAVHKDGTILLHNSHNVVNRYASDGRFLAGFRVQRAPGGRGDIPLGENGSFYSPNYLLPDGIAPVKEEFRRPTPVTGINTPEWRRPLFHYDTLGRVIDSVVLERPWLDSNEPSYSTAPSQSWMPTPDGRLIVSRTDKLGFVLVDLSGKNAPLLAEIPTVVVPYTDEERAEQEKSNAEGAKPMMEGGRVISPGNKTPPLTAARLASSHTTIDIEGRVWQLKTVPAEKVEPYCTFLRDGVCVRKSIYRSPEAYVAIQLDGTYLGEVRFPPKTGLVRFKGDYAWAVTWDDDDVATLVKYRIHK